MESREAFERRGERHGVFVESLRKHLAQPKRVNFMLTDVQNDVQRSCLQVNTDFDNASVLTLIFETRTPFKIGLHLPKIIKRTFM